MARALNCIPRLRNMLFYYPVLQKILPGNKKVGKIPLLWMFLVLLILPIQLKADIPPDLTGQIFFASSPSGLGWDFSVWVIDLDKNQTRRVIDLTGRLYWINELDISNDGKRLAISGNDIGSGDHFDIWI